MRRWTPATVCAALNGLLTARQRVEDPGAMVTLTSIFSPAPRLEAWSREDMCPHPIPIQGLVTSIKAVREKWVLVADDVQGVIENEAKTEGVVSGVIRLAPVRPVEGEDLSSQEISVAYQTRVSVDPETCLCTFYSSLTNDTWV